MTAPPQPAPAVAKLRAAEYARSYILTALMEIRVASDKLGEHSLFYDAVRGQLCEAADGLGRACGVLDGVGESDG